MSSRTIYALTAGQKPVVITNHFYMRLCTQFFFWCILDEKEGPILVDQSFTQRCLDEMKIPYQVKEGPLELLDRINVRPEDVRHVILSHLHWDHYAGDEFYPNARYHVHQKELEYVTGPLMRFTTYAQHYNFKAIEHLLHLHFSGRVHLVQDEREEICEGGRPYARPDVRGGGDRRRDEDHLQRCRPALPEHQRDDPLRHPL